MINIENKVNTIVYNAVSPSYPNAKFESGLNLSPSVFPCICVEEIGNTTRKSSIDSGSNENHADVEYEINIFTNNTSGKRTVARDILSLIDSALIRCGFARSGYNPIPLENGTKYRLVARYAATVGKDNYIYRR